MRSNNIQQRMLYNFISQHAKLIISTICIMLSSSSIKITAAPYPNSKNNEMLLASVISVEAENEIYTAQVAIAAVILNRVKHPSFPDTLAGVVYQHGAFNTIYSKITMQRESTYIKAARDALNGWDPTGGSIYYWKTGSHDDANLNYTRSKQAPYDNKAVIGSYSFGSQYTGR